MKHLILASDFSLGLPGQYPEEKNKMKVLIVDDEPIIGNLLEAGLSEAGFEAAYFSTGAEALDSIHRIRPDIIISDIVMPYMDAYELRRRVRQDPRTAGIPFIFLSARTETSDQLEGLRTGPDDYIFKPFKMENLIERVKSVMERSAKHRTFQSQTEFSADLNRTNINDIIQNIAINRKNGELVFVGAKDGNKLGTAFFSEGKLVNAETDSLKGEEAFYRLTDAAEGNIRFYEKAVNTPHIITARIVTLMQNINRAQEDAKKLYRRVPNLNVVPRIISDDLMSAAAADDKGGRENASRVLAMISEQKTAEEIISSGIMSRARTAAMLLCLLDAGNVSFKEGSEIRDQRSEAEVQNFTPPPSPASPPPPIFEENFLKMLRSFEQGRLSGMLEVRDRPERAVIWFENGGIVHAVHGNTVGKKALYRIFSDCISADSGNPKFKVQRFSDEKTIEGSLDELLEEGAGEISKFRDLKDSTFENTVTVNEDCVQKTDKLEGRPGLNHILSLARTHSKVRDIIADSRMTDFQAYRHLFYLVKRGILSVGQKSRPKIQLITDSTADLPSDIADRHNIIVLPLSVTQGQKFYINQADDMPGSRGGTVKISDTLPAASAPGEEDFSELFGRIIPEKDILAVFLSGKISKTFENALSAERKNADEYLGRRQQNDPDAHHFHIEIIDSHLVSVGLGLLIAEAADKIEEGWEIGRISDYIKKLIPMIRIFFVAENFDRYLQTGGASFKAEGGVRSKLSRIYRSLGGIRPIFSLWNGEVTVIDQVRGRKNARNRILEWIEQGLDNPSAPVKVGIMHADVIGWAGTMREMLKERFNCRDVMISRVSPTGGSYCGPGTVAVAYFPMPEEERIVFKSYGRPA